MLYSNRSKLPRDNNLISRLHETSWRDYITRSGGDAVGIALLSPRVSLVHSQTFHVAANYLSTTVSVTNIATDASHVRYSCFDLVPSSSFFPSMGMIYLSLTFA